MRRAKEEQPGVSLKPGNKPETPGKKRPGRDKDRRCSPSRKRNEKGAAGQTPKGGWEESRAAAAKGAGAMKKRVSARKPGAGAEERPTQRTNLISGERGKNGAESINGARDESRPGESEEEGKIEMAGTRGIPHLVRRES